MYKITVVGLGYVGLSLACLISQKYQVIAYDIDKNKVRQINEGVSPITDQHISDFLKSKDLNLLATSDEKVAYSNRDFYIVATPTDYDEHTQFFDTSSVESVIDTIAEFDPNAAIVIKSTVPIFFTQRMIEKYPEMKILFSPEFLREGSSLYDNLYPSRIIVSPDCSDSRIFSDILVECASKKDVEVLVMGTSEAESVKLFSNTYLAMRVAFFNELDTFAESKNLNASQIIKGVSLDNRIGNYYNNPSFGYGGYCLPKDTKQLKANFGVIPSSLIHAIVDANSKRKEYIAGKVVERNPNTVGIYKLAMKSGSDNFRFSSIRDVMELISKQGIKVIIFDEALKGFDNFDGFDVISDYNQFIEKSDLILTNRMYDELKTVLDKVYTRDVFGDN